MRSCAGVCDVELVACFGRADRLSRHHEPPRNGGRPSSNSRGGGAALAGTRQRGAAALANAPGGDDAEANSVTEWGRAELARLSFVAWAAAPRLEVKICAKVWERQARSALVFVIERVRVAAQGRLAFLFGAQRAARNLAQHALFR